MSVQLINNSFLHHRISSLGGNLTVINTNGWFSLRIEFSHKINSVGAAIIEYVNISLRDDKTLHVVSLNETKTFSSRNKYLFKNTYARDENLMSSIRDYLIKVNYQ
jgi:hypothetical protein